MASPPITFPCPFCTRRMGVLAELLGRQVRCPHCKQVVVAPVTAGTPPAPVAVAEPQQPAPVTIPTPSTPTVVAPLPAPELRAFNIPQKKEGADSILSEPDESDDEVFGSQPGSRLPTLPRDPPPPPESASQPAPVSDDPFGFGPASAAPPPPEPAAGNYTQPLLTATIFDLPPNVRPAPDAPKESPNPFAEMDAPAPTPAVPQKPVPLPVPVPQPALPKPVPVPARPVAPAPTVPASGNPFEDFDDAPAPIPVLLPTPVEPARAAPAPTTDELPDEPPLRKQPRNESRDDDKPARATRSRPAASPSGGGAKNVVLFLLAGYALVATALAVYGLFFKSGDSSETHPLSTIPDNFGEFDPVSRKKVTQHKFRVDGELPAAQRAAIGGKVVIGQIEVQPVRVEKRFLSIKAEGRNEKEKPQTTKTTAAALVLTLDIKNTSEDLSIFPMDPAFTRRESKADQPITRLVVDKKVFAGGEIEWPLPSKFKKRIEVQQANDAIPLKPNESREYVVFTAASAELVEAAKTAKESLQWRIQVRRGLVDYKGKELPVTAVIGVDFKSNEIR